MSASSYASGVRVEDDSSGLTGVARSRRSREAGTGRGTATAHHGEILQGVFEDPPGRLRRALVSLGCALFRSEACFAADTSGSVKVRPTWKVKARCAAELTLATCGARMGGLLTIRSNTPRGWGLGSSTSDVLAAIRAVADLLGCYIPETTVARLAVGAETASDPTMFGDRAVLFAHREGKIIEDFGGTLPPLDVLGFNTDPSGAGIDTLRFPRARYTWWEIEAFRPLLGLLRNAIQARDARLCGRVASASARLNQRHLATPHLDRLERLVEATGAVGFQVAHSGTIAGLLFDGRGTDLDARFELGRAVLRDLGCAPMWRFKTCDHEVAS